MNSQRGRIDGSTTAIGKGLRSKVSERLKDG